MKDNRGEISIQMVVTGIVLIVMIGICIFMLTGENGLFIRREDETEKNEIVTNNTLDAEEQNITSNENGALTVPVE